MDYKVIQWNIDSDDWKLEHNPPPYLAEHVAHMIPPRDHSREGSYIILEHDTYRYTVANQVDIIRGLKSKGYRLVSMTECLGTTKLYKRRKIIEAEVEDEHRIEYEDIFESYNTSV